MSAATTLAETPETAASRAALRHRLGIPRDAARVLVFSESSHWDTNWLESSEAYFQRRLEPIFEKILEALEREPLRVYGVESVFFLKLYWERHPERQEELRALIEGGRLKILSSSFTTPDTLLPHPEAILRDFHLGQDWLRAQGLSVVPRTAYFPDSFGHSPHLPSLMRAVGVTAVGITRIDGMYFIASDYRRKSAFPLRGSTAALLEKECKTLDFVWRDDDGAEVLCHWNAFTYFQGDMLAHLGFVRWNGLVAAVPWRTRSHIARRIDRFVRELAPLSRTPYMLCPIGMDFNDPIEGIRELLDRYNRERYQTTGTWTVLAGLDDYFDLLGTERDKLPVLSVDPNPYWMGFYSSRPELKQRPMRVARSLVVAETISALEPPHPPLERSLREAWSSLVLLNHHDAITGTSPDHVVGGEQRSWLDRAEAAATHVLGLVGSRLKAVAPEGGPAPPSRPSPPPEQRWHRDGSRVIVVSGRTKLTFCERRGGCLTSLELEGKEQLAGLGLDLVAYSDEGGLWRLGHEFRGGRFSPFDRASSRAAQIDVRRDDGALTIRVTSTIAGRTFQRAITCRPGDPFVHVRVTGSAPRRATITCLSALAEGATSLEMDTIGGRIERPRERGHQPTFWPVPSWISLAGKGPTLHVGFEAPTAVSFRPDHTLEWIVARNACKERAFRLLPVLAHPIGGTSDDPQTHHAAMFVAPEGASHDEVRDQLESFWLAPDERELRVFSRSLVQFSDSTVTLAAAKRADRGDGLIVRLASERRHPRTVRVWLPSRRIVTAAACDAREHDLSALEVDAEGAALVPLAARLTTVRLVHASS